MTNQCSNAGVAPLKAASLWACAFFMALWSCPPEALADEFHYRSLLIGDRALGMGGAFTAIADDPSAAYYNPAGLSLIDNSSVSASLQVNSLDRRSVDNAYAGVGNQQASFRHSADPSVPIFVSLLKKFGPKDEEGNQRHAFGLSTFHPDRRTLNYRVSLDSLDVVDPNTRIFEDFRLRHEDATSWFGPSYSFAPNQSLAFGLSAFLATRSMRHEEELSQIDTDATGANTADTQRFLQQRSDVSLDTRHLVLRLGAMFAVTSRIQVGVMVQPPGLELTSEASVRALSLSAFPGELPQFARSTQKLSATSPIPWELRTGIGYFAPYWDLKLSFDVSLHGPSGSRDNPVQAIGNPREDSTFAGYTPWLGNYLVQQYSRVVTVNAAMGMEVTVAEVMPLRVGLFTNRSSAPDVPRRGQAYAPDDVHQYGGSLSVGLRTGGYDLSLGGAVMLGWGDGLRTLGPNDFDPAEPSASYGRTDVRDSTLVFFITGYRQALSRAARVAYQEL